MTIRTFILEQQPTDLLARRLRQHPTDHLTYGELCRRGEAALANQIRADENYDRAIEKLDNDQLTELAFSYDRALGSSDRVQGGLA
jgi:hypothetical protein